MSCQSVANYSKQCGRGISGGVSKLYVVGYGDLKVISGSTDVFAYASGTTIVNSINFPSGKTFAECGILKESVSFKGTAKRDSSNGSFSNETEVQVTISNISETAKQYVESLFQQPVALLIKLRSGNWIVNGLNGFTELTQAAEASGTKNADANGYVLTFSGVQDGLTQTVDATYASTIITSN